MVARRKLLSAGLLIAVLAALVAGFQPVRSASRSAQSNPTASPSMHIFGALWKLGPGQSSALLLRNQNRQLPASVHLVLFSPDGSTELITDLSLPPAATSRVDLADLLKLSDSSLHWGGLSLDVTGQIRGQILIQDASAHSSFSLDLHAGYRFDTENTLQVPWWLPNLNQNQALLTAFNASEQTIIVNPSLSIGQQESSAPPFALPPHQSRQFNLADLLRQSKLDNSATGSITLHYSGPAHALLPTLLISSSTAPFALLPTVNPRHLQSTAQQTVWHFPEVALSSNRQVGVEKQAGVTAYALLSNTTSAPLAPDLLVSFGGLKNQHPISPAPGNAAPAKSHHKANQRAVKVAVPLTPLLPLETRLINLSDLAASGLIPKGISHFALTLRHPGLAGDLGISVFSVEKTTSLVFPAAAILQPSSVVDSTYWSTGRRVALPAVKNDTDSPAQVQATLHFQTAHGIDSFVLPPLQIPSRHSRSLGIKQILQSKTIDEIGNSIPTGVTSGIATLVLVNNVNNVPNNNVVPGAVAPLSALPVETSALCFQTCNLPPSPDALNAPLPATTLTAPPVTASASSLPPVHFSSADCPPLVTGITPSTAPAGQTVDVTISGEDLDDSDVSVTGGITAVVNDISPDGTSLSATFTIPFDPSAVGTWVVTVANLAGSDNVDFVVTTPPAPAVESIDPTSAQAGTSIPVIIDSIGRSFHDGDSISVTGGISASITSVDPGGQQLQATFTIPICSSGTQQVVISDPFGQSSTPATFTVTDPAAPVITSISPVSWQAGAGPIHVTITGSGMNCNPAVSSSDPDITFGPASFVSPDDPSTIAVDATVDATDPGGQVQVFVNTASGGFGAAGLPLATKISPTLISAKATSSAPPKAATKPATTLANPTTTLVSNPELVTVVAEAAPRPIILMVDDPASPPACTSDNDIGAPPGGITDTKTVRAGQRVYLLACLPAGTQIQMTNPTWSIDNNALVVGGYDDGAGGGKPSNAKAVVESVKLNQTSLIFYFIAPTQAGTQLNATFKYTPSNQQPDASAVAGVQANGPIAGTLQPKTGEVTMRMVPGTPMIDGTHFSPPVFEAGDLKGVTPGMVFNVAYNTTDGLAPQSTSGGLFVWGQIMTLFHQRARPGKDCSFSNGLDNLYPLPDTPAFGNEGREDTPGIPLLAQFGEEAVNVQPTMYLLWQPPVTQACRDASTPAAPCSIPVPLGSTVWQFKGDSINTLDSTKGVAGTPWTIEGCSATGGTAGAPVFAPNQTSSGYPTWSTRFQNQTTCPLP